MTGTERGERKLIPEHMTGALTEIGSISEGSC